MTATRGDGGGDIAVLAGRRCSRRVPLRSAPPQPFPVGEMEGRGRSPLYCVSWAALRLDPFQMRLLNLTDEAAAMEVSKPVVKYLIHSLRFPAYLGCSLCSVSGV